MSIQPTPKLCPNCKIPFTFETLVNRYDGSMLAIYKCYSCNLEDFN